MKKHLPLIFLLFFSAVFSLFFYHRIIFHPNSYLFGDSGDAIKNYFTYSYHIRHDSPLFNFEGMNYPYGEHIYYTDCHPLLAMVFKVVSGSDGFITRYSIGILNFTLILSVFLTFIASYFLLKRFSINSWLSVLFSISITVLAPQLFRLGGHLALSYSLAIPLSWLLLILALKSARPGVLMLLFVNCLLWLFIHAYLGVIIIIFLLLITSIYFMKDRSRRGLWPQYSGILAALLIPVALFYVSLKLTDTHTGRTTNPTGFFLYNAEPDDVFLPNHPPLKPVFDSIAGGSIKQEWEAWSYIGFATVLIVLTILVLSVTNLFKKNKSEFIATIFSSNILNVSIFSALVLLLFAMAIPFKQIPTLVDLFPLVKQFRATGRFTWPFYFVSMVFAARVLQQWYDRFRGEPKNLMVSLLILLAGTFNIIEGLPYHSEAAASMIKSPNLFDKNQLSESFKNAIDSINVKDYQAIVPLPFYYQGSESFSRPRNDATVRASMVVSYHTGLPVAGANLTRTSIEESKKIVQLVSPNYYRKEILDDLPDSRPFLVLRTGDELTGYENDLLARSSLLFKGTDVAVYALKKEALFENASPQTAAAYHRIKGQLFLKDGFGMTKENAFLYYNGFENRQSDTCYMGKGAYKGMKRGKNTFAEFPSNTFSKDQQYIVRLWMFNGVQDALNDWFRLIVEEYDEKNNSWISTTFFPEQCETINGDWSLAEFTFSVQNPNNRISVVCIGKEYEKQPLFADELLITEAGVDVYRYNISDRRLYFNNHTISVE